jgi:hypothetical protein
MIFIPRRWGPADILTPSVTVRGVLNMTPVTAVEAQVRTGRQQAKPCRLDRKNVSKR